MLGNSSYSRPLAVLADLDRAAKVPRASRFSRLARALRERPRLARVSGRPRRASNASGLDTLDAVIGRAPRNTQPNNLMTASIELMRCGDVAIATNGVSWTVPRELPFAHDGFGQDAEWVAANFTNATEIAAAGGYAAWVDAQVGEGLTNGLYKLTIGVCDDPPETFNLVVGNLSVAVTNAGEYVFLLEKGVEYEYGTIPFLTNET